MVKSIFVLVISTVIVLLASACSKRAPAKSPTGGMATAATAGDGDVAHGKIVFTENCAVCHGANGTNGGIGPSLHDEKSRKNAVKTIVWIKNPEPPMPKLYPSPLGEKDVADVAAFVQTL